MISKSSLIFCLLGIAFLLGFKQAASQDKNWTHFRGSELNGLAPGENIPLKLDSSTIKWKTKIHDSGYSSPVIYNNQIWVTTAKSDGKDLYAVCIDFLTGKIIYDISVFTPVEIEGKHSTNTYASPTPCIEKGFVYVHYGNMGTACINTSMDRLSGNAPILSVNMCRVLPPHRFYTRTSLFCTSKVLM